MSDDDASPAHGLAFGRAFQFIVQGRVAYDTDHEVAILFIRRPVDILGEMINDIGVYSVVGFLGL